uniref:superoxide dismutase n=1 Tax=Echinostoma caproni TaxID=27848 RepID=A0A183A489_9TREM
LQYLPYDYNALEPTISAEIMKLHHGKHHAAYVHNYNIAEDQLREAEAKNDTTKIIALQVKSKNGCVVNFCCGSYHIRYALIASSPEATADEDGKLLNLQTRVKRILHGVLVQRAY